VVGFVTVKKKKHILDLEGMLDLDEMSDLYEMLVLKI